MHCIILVVVPILNSYHRRRVRISRTLSRDDGLRLGPYILSLPCSSVVVHIRKTSPPTTLPAAAQRFIPQNTIARSCILHRHRSKTPVSNVCIDRSIVLLLCCTDNWLQREQRVFCSRGDRRRITAWLFNGRAMMRRMVGATSHPADCRSVLSNGMTEGCGAVFALSCIQHVTDPSARFYSF